MTEDENVPGGQMQVVDRRTDQMQMVDGKVEHVQPDDSPGGLIRFALTHGATIEQMEKLVALKSEMSAEQAKKAYHHDMAEARAEMSSTIKRRGENKQTQSKFVLLCDLVEAYAPVLAKFGFNYSWVPDQTRQKGWVYITCVVTHRDGHSESYPLGAPEDNVGLKGQTNKTAVQGIGSVTSYLERYTFQAAFGVAASDSDNDGNKSRDRQEPDYRPGQRQEATGNPPHENAIARLRALYDEAVLFEQASGKTTQALRLGVRGALDRHDNGQLSADYAGVIIGKAKASLTSAGWTEPPEWTEERAERSKAKRAEAKEESKPEAAAQTRDLAVARALEAGGYAGVAASVLMPHLYKLNAYLERPELAAAIEPVFKACAAGKLTVEEARMTVDDCETWLDAELKSKQEAETEPPDRPEEPEEHYDREPGDQG